MGAIGIGIICLHNLLPLFVGAARASPAWQLVYFGFGNSLGPLVILYTVIPWIGVMAAGYAFGAVAEAAPARRRAICLALGVGAIAAFVALRWWDRYGDPRPWHAAPATIPALLRFLNTTKYPASLSFLLMTLGPLVLLVPLAERGPRVLEVFGRVPLFYYLLHIPLIHLAALAVSLFREGRVDPWLFENHPMRMEPAPAAYIWSLPLLYAVTAAVVAALYPLCRSFGERKRARPSGWTSLL